MKNFEQYGDIELYYLLSSDKETSEKAFAELYKRYSSRIYAYCRRFLSNKEEAQDIFQETFIRLYQSAKQERVMTNVPGFILRIARNLCVNSKRNEKNNISFEDYMIQNSESNDKQELLNLVKMALDLLPPEYKDMFILREYEGLSYNEIAKVTDTTMATVKIRLFRAKKKIREILSPYLSEISKFI